MGDEPAPKIDGEVLAFIADGERIGIPAEYVAEIIRPRPLTRVPHSRLSLLGLLNLRGTILPVVSMSRLLGRAGGPASAATRIIILAKSPPWGLLVDAVADLTNAANERVVNLDSLMAQDFAEAARPARVAAAADGAIKTSAPARIIEERLLLAFVVSGQEYAFPLAEVSEVIALPPSVSTVPGADRSMAGVANLRGTLLPLVSLRALLGLSADGFDRRKSRIVVVPFANHWVGLVADSMREILRVPKTAIDPVPVVLTRGRAEAKIEAICRLDGGERLVSLLATAKIFDNETVSRILAETQQGAAQMSAGSSDGGTVEQFVVFQLGDEYYGLPVAAVDEVVRRPEKLTRVPRAPAFIEGVTNLRGKVIPVIDQRQRFSVSGAKASRDSRVIIVTISDVQAGFIVDAVSEILGVAASEIDSAPALATSGSQLFDRVATIERDGRMILLINPQALLDRVERDLLLAMAEEPAPAP